MKSTTSNQKLYVSNTFYNNEKRNSYLVTSLIFYEKFRYANVIMFSNVFLTFTDDYLSGPFIALGERKWEERWLLNFRILWEIEGGLVGAILGLYHFFKTFAENAEARDDTIQFILLCKLFIPWYRLLLITKKILAAWDFAEEKKQGLSVHVTGITLQVLIGIHWGN